MRRTAPPLLAALLLGAALLPTVPARAGNPSAPVSSSLERQLAAVTGTIPVFVHGTSIAAARQAVADAGLTLLTTWNKIGVAGARGRARQNAPVRAHSGGTHVGGDHPLPPYLASSNTPPPGAPARPELPDAPG